MGLDSVLSQEAAMTEERWANADRLNVFIETAGALADQAINALSGPTSIRGSSFLTR